MPRFRLSPLGVLGAISGDAGGMEDEGAGGGAGVGAGMGREESVDAKSASRNG